MKRIPVAMPVLNGNEKLYVMDCIDSNWISSVGSYIKRFEQQFAEYCEAGHAISCCNGTVALHLALLAYGVGPGDEVIAPTLSYIATANSVSYCGAIPIFVDSEPETWNIDPQKIEAKITSKTKGIIVVHLYGHPADMDAIMRIARKHGLFVIEDAAEAHGATYRNRRSGSLGDIATFSFFGNKVITTGEGGMVVTSNAALAEKMRLLKGQGMDPKRRYWFPVIGYNYRMTNIAAAIGLAQLEQIEWHLNKRQEIARRYTKHFEGLRNFFSLPVQKDWATHSYWMFTILVNETVALPRDTLMALLNEDGIETRPVFYPMHVLPPYLDTKASFPIADRVAARGINLPTHAMLTDRDIEFIVERVAHHSATHA